jgi:hypothetical protein
MYSVHRLGDAQHDVSDDVLAQAATAAVTPPVIGPAVPLASSSTTLSELRSVCCRPVDVAATPSRLVGRSGMASSLRRDREVRRGANLAAIEASRSPAPYAVLSL